MRERPILFSGPMVRAILAGQKTVTRRVVVPQPPRDCEYAINGAQSHALCFHRERRDLPPMRDPTLVWVPPTGKSVDHRLPCPYGEPVDRLWVRETFRKLYSWGTSPSGECDIGTDWGARHYEADGAPPTLGRDDHRYWRKFPSIFMRRTDSRLTLEVVGVRVERLQEITDPEVVAEGVIAERGPRGEYVSAFRGPTGGAIFETARALWQSGWDSINGKRPGCAWADNPWVWRVEFRRVEPAS